MELQADQRWALFHVYHPPLEQSNYRWTVKNSPSTCSLLMTDLSDWEFPGSELVRRKIRRVSRRADVW